VRCVLSARFNDLDREVRHAGQLGRDCLGSGGKRTLMIVDRRGHITAHGVTLERLAAELEVLPP
jgi:hypothetical protein